MVISGKITHEMGMNTVCSFFPSIPQWKQVFISPTLGTTYVGCELTMLNSLVTWMIWISALGREESAHGLGSQGLGSRVSEGNLHHTGQCPDEPLTSSCKYRINGRLDELSRDLLSELLYCLL